MAVDGPGITDAERFEEPVRGDDLAHGAGEPVHSGVGEVAESGKPPQQQAHALAGVDVGRVEAQVGQFGRQLGNRRGIRAAVVVQDDDDPAARVAQVVERLVGHAAGERPVADHRHHPPVDLTAHAEPGGDPVRIAERGRRVAVLDPVVLRLGSRRVSRHAARLAQAWRTVVGVRSGACACRPDARCPTAPRRRGESKTRWTARVSSTTPRFDPRCPPVVVTVSTMRSRISDAS